MISSKKIKIIDHSGHPNAAVHVADMPTCQPNKAINNLPKSL